MMPRCAGLLPRVCARVGHSGHLPARREEVDEIVAKLSPVELEQVIKIVGRSPRGYAPGALEALKGKRNSAQPQRPTERLSPNVALKPGQPAHTNSGAERSRRIHVRGFTAPKVPQRSTERTAHVLAWREALETEHIELRSEWATYDAGPTIPAIL